MEGFALVAFLSRQPALEELRLQEVRLTRMSPDWAAIVDDLCLLFGVQFEGGKNTISGIGAGKVRRKRIKGVVLMERIGLELERCFEPSDGRLERGVSIESEELKGFFKGSEDNPLRSAMRILLRLGGMRKSSEVCKGI